MRPIAIIDTNVVVAGLLTNVAESPVARILDAMLDGAFAHVLSEALLAEYRDVLLRPKLIRLHGLSADEIEAILVDIAHGAIFLQPVDAAAAPDPGDQHLWELLAARPDLVLVSGDKYLLQDSPMSGRVITPETFWRMR